MEQTSKYLELKNKLRKYRLKAEALREEARFLESEEERKSNLDKAWDCDNAADLIDEVLSNGTPEEIENFKDEY